MVLRSLCERQHPVYSACLVPVSQVVFLLDHPEAHLMLPNFRFLSACRRFSADDMLVVFVRFRITHASISTVKTLSNSRRIKRHTNSPLTHTHTHTHTHTFLTLRMMAFSQHILYTAKMRNNGKLCLFVFLRLGKRPFRQTACFFFQNISWSGLH